MSCHVASVSGALRVVLAFILSQRPMHAGAVLELAHQFGCELHPICGHHWGQLRGPSESAGVLH
eukprot:2958480-Pyramimonas_sp.AAC.2